MSLDPDLKKAIDRFSIVNVLLSEIHAAHDESYDPETSPSDDGREIFFRLTGPDLKSIQSYEGETEGGIRIRRSAFRMHTKFVVGRARRTDPSDDPNSAPDQVLLGSVVATFLVTFDEQAGPEGEFLNETQRSLFGQHNVPLNVWPYWRELIQSALRRLGLPDVVLPLHRLKRKATAAAPDA